MAETLVNTDKNSILKIFSKNSLQTYFCVIETYLSVGDDTSREVEPLKDLQVV